LQGPCLPIVAHSDIEDDRVGVELWGSVSINRTRGIVLDFAATSCPVVSAGLLLPIRA
jgi:hypothetical protein